MNQEKIDAIKIAHTYIERLYEGIKEARVCCLTGEDTKGYELLTQITDGLTWLIDVIGLTQECYKEEIHLGEMPEILAEMVEALENGDMVLIADILEYEIIVKLEEWYKQMGEVLAAC